MGNTLSMNLPKFPNLLQGFFLDTKSPPFLIKGEGRTAEARLRTKSFGLCDKTPVASVISALMRDPAAPRSTRARDSMLPATGEEVT